VALPEGEDRRALWNAHFFSLFNALSWQIALGAPIILFAKGLGATSTVLGLITALTPLLVIFQIPAAHWLPKFGYRRFTLMGWGTRTVAVFAVAAVPLATYAGVSVQWQLAAVLGLMLTFNTLRGIASGAWMPWLTEIVPAHYRATFLSRDNLFGNLGSLLSLGVASVLLLSAATPAPWQFSLVFLFSALAAVVSLHFLRKIPDVTAPESLKSSGHPVPWGHMFRWPPFFKIVVFVLGWVWVTGGLSTFSVAYLRGVAGFTDSQVILLSAVTLLGSLVSVSFGGLLVDRLGSPRMLRGCMAVLLVSLLGWAAMAGRLLPGSVAVVAGLNLLTGIAAVNFNVAASRLTMATFPLMGRNHFFAMYSVITNLGLGLSPIVWGMGLDFVGDWHRAAGPAEVNRYTLYFAAVAGVTAVTLVGSALLLDRSQGTARPTAEANS
jgi:MFS family permease